MDGDLRQEQEVRDEGALISNCVGMGGAWLLLSRRGRQQVSGAQKSYDPNYFTEFSSLCMEC